MDSSSGIGSFPLALSLAYKMEDEVQAKYDGLTESEKEEILNRCKDAKSADEVQDIVRKYGAEEEIRDLLDGPMIG